MTGLICPKSEKLQKTKEMGIEVDPDLEDFEVTNDVFEKMIEHTLDSAYFCNSYSKGTLSACKNSQIRPFHH